MLMLRIIFHLPGLVDARDAIEREFAASTHRLPTEPRKRGVTWLAQRLISD
jgi:hypothetical protein